MDGGGGGATTGKVRLEPVETAGCFRIFRRQKLLGLDQDVETKLLGPVSRAAVAGSGGGVENSVRVNSDERERERTGERERGELK
ncbi:unnamed protein product [Prunus armeniaca]